MRRAAVGMLVCLFAIAAARAAPLRVGEDVIKRYDTPHPYPAAAEGAADLVWTKELSFAGASYIAVHFSRFHLSPGDFVIVRSPDDRQEWRYEGLGRGELGESEGGFWASHIRGDTAIVELHGKTGGVYGFTIDRFARGYPPEELNPESICGIDNANWAKCYEVSEPTIYERGRTVARLLIQGSGLCTGWLIGNTGHLMTNHHCILTASDALNTDYEFNAEGATCATSCSAQLSCPGTIEATTATLVQTDAPLDFSLVLLPTNITSTYGYLTLRGGGPAVVNERMYILGHPGGKGKRFSVSSTDPSDASGFCEVLNLTTDPSLDCIPEATELDVGYLCDTEGGSSGSPVLGYSDHKVIALHHCGGCANSGVQITGVIASLGPNVPPGSVFSPAGVVALDGSVYGCSGTIGIEVRDDNLIGAGSQGVTVESTTEAAPEPVTLAESPPASGRFLGTIPATAGPVAGGDSLLSVADGDTITARYLDLDDGTGNPAARTDTATVDCVAPIITNVQAINVTGNSADITFTTGEGASSTATYGLASSPPPASTASNSALVTSHSVHLTGLLPCRDYIFSVSAADAAGNTATNDNAGAYYTFSTGVNASPTYQATGLPVSIPDNNPTGASSSIAVPDINPVADVNVLVRITHTYDGDLVLSLTGPNGATVTLSDRRGASGDNFTDTLFDDAAATSISAGVAPFAGSFRPESALSAFNGISAAGTWTLRAVDIAGLDVGTVDRFEMHFTYPPQACGPYIRHQSHTVADACSGAGSGGDGVVDPGEDLSIPVVLANTGTDPADGVTAVLSTTTPGVSVVTGSASYGTVAPGQTAAGSNPYVVHVGDSVPCGTLIDLQIAASATGGGPWSEAFTVRVGTPVVSGPTTHSSTDVPRAILDAATVTSVINVSSTSSVVDVNVGFSLTHPWDADLDISLVGPNGAVVELTTDNGSSGDNYTNTLFDDSAATAITAGTAPFTGTFRPEQPLAALNGIPANGAWTLRITDDESPDAGNLLSWFIVLTVQSGFLCNACVVLVPPGEVGSLRFGAPDTLEWGPVATATGYRVYRGVRSDLPRLYTTDPDSCLRTTSASTSMSGLGETPPASDFSWWLVRAANGVGEGPAGSGTPGPRIHDSAGACP